MRRQFSEIIVEWDVNKEKINIQKHGLDFETAMLVFADEGRVEAYDYKHSKREVRYAVIGMVNKLITVIYAEKRKNIRIISARKATAEERRKYHERNS